MSLAEKLEMLRSLETVDFEQVAEIVINSCLSANSQSLPYKAVAKKLAADPADVQDAVDGLTYFVLQACKANVSEKDFARLFEQTQLKGEFQQPLYELLMPVVKEIREILAQEGEQQVQRFKDIEWRFSVVMGCKGKKKMMLPKYTLRLTLEEDCEEKQLVLDADYANLKRLEDELREALKASESTYCKKVYTYFK